MDGIWLRLLLCALFAYLALLLLLFGYQRKLLYLPFGGAVTVDEASRYGLRHWPAAEHALGFIAPEPPAVRGTVLLFHGNAGAAYHRAVYAEALTALGLRVILAEYPGYGGRPGKPGEDALVLDAAQTMRLAHRHFGEPLYLWGESLGAGVVAGAVARSDVPVAGLVLVTPWDSMARVAQRHYHWLPVRWLLRDRYDNVDALGKYPGPVAVILAGRDEVVPPSHGRALFDALGSTRRLWVFDDATHNTLPLTPGLDWWRDVDSFIVRRSGDGAD